MSPDRTSDGRVIAPGVSVIATPGHTPGHLSLVVASGVQRAIILGDVMHCPVQFDEADWSVVFDVDTALARRTRERLMRELEDPSTISADGHFSEGGANHEVRRSFLTRHFRQSRGAEATQADRPSDGQVATDDR